ncbi:MAG TPA: hypothetical protein VK912_15690 [Longimicrobiales bacterium]|nr:hypothetical protein [Longimicrobiales bacterium]
MAADTAAPPVLARLAGEYRDLLVGGADSAGLVAAAAVSAGWTAAAGEALGGEGYFADEDWTGAQPLERTSEPAIALGAHGHLSDPHTSSSAA